MSLTNRSKIIEELASSIDIPDEAYVKAEKRYLNLGEWLSREGSTTARFRPQIRPQGSFRIGTVHRPVVANESYDLDLGCRFLEGISKFTHTQRELKELVGAEVEAYRKAWDIKEQLEEKKRCWRLYYADELSFHMDVVPSIPEEVLVRASIVEAMVTNGEDPELAATLSEHNGSITDNTELDYDIISENWNVSNAEGFALWFEHRMKQSKILEARAFQAKVASIDQLKPYRWKSPLQRSVQILKRHRDVMFAQNPDGKPISVILTTLSGLAYSGENTVEEALDGILSRMDAFVDPSHPRILNPVNPAENFAEKWIEDPTLRHNFTNWLQQARRDFAFLKNTRDVNDAAEFVQRRFKVSLSESLRSSLDFGAPAVISATKEYEITGTPARPWKKA